ncbi:MAG: HAMP domain-containing histidine kinase [Desulfomonile tiedjei]|nr:HAMP domain-containing histidine kinase [Desulfomonile tiedjei]
MSRFRDLFDSRAPDEPRFTDESFSHLLQFLEEGEPSFQGVAVQAGVRWSDSSQRVMLRNTILRRGFVSPSCLWAYRQARGNADELFVEFDSSEMAFMQILLMKETDPARSVPFLLERFLTRKEIPEELRTTSRLCVLRLLDTGVSPDVLKSLRTRYSGVEILCQWRPSIPGRGVGLNAEEVRGAIDFHQLVRSVQDMRDLSSLTRTVYLLSLFYVPLAEKEWRSLWLGRTDQLFFQRLRLAGMVEPYNGGFLLSTDTTKQNVLKKFLYESYTPAKESIHRHRAERIKEDRERRVRNSELDRQALEMVSDGIICVDRSGFLYYMNPAAESLLNESTRLRERLFGPGALADALRRYSRDDVLARVTAGMKEQDDTTEVFGDRVAIAVGGKRFEVELGAQVILIRDTTDRYLIDQEIGKLYRHELKAALDVMAAGLDTARQLVAEGRNREGLTFLEQAEEKREELCSMLEERIDFIRLHSDAFQIRPTPVNLNLVVDKCIGNYREPALAKGVTIKSNHLHVSAVQVRGEERFLRRALDNIVRNAVKFTNKGGEIKISVGEDNLDATLSVEDTGPGIIPENLGKIFQLGFTTSGTGRGLYLARRIVQAHNGKIEAKSKPGNGACFTVRLPLMTEV